MLPFSIITVHMCDHPLFFIVFCLAMRVNIVLPLLQLIFLLYNFDRSMQIIVVCDIPFLNELAGI
jgi:hypothetical protein